MKTEPEKEVPLSEEQRQLVIDNMGLLKKFYYDEVMKGYIPIHMHHEFKSDLMRRFCLSALKYDEDTGFKFSTFAYGGFRYCVGDIKKKIIKNGRLSHLGDCQEDVADLEGPRLLIKRRVIKFLEYVPISEREKNVISLCYLERLTLQEVGEILGVSKQRVGQIRVEAEDKIRIFVYKKEYEVEDFVKDR